MLAPVPAVRWSVARDLRRHQRLVMADVPAPARVELPELLLCWTLQQQQTSGETFIIFCANGTHASRYMPLWRENNTINIPGRFTNTKVSVNSSLTTYLSIYIFYARIFIVLASLCFTCQVSENGSAIFRCSEFMSVEHISFLHVLHEHIVSVLFLC